MNRNILTKMISCLTFLAILLFVFCKITWLYRGNGIESREDIQGFKNQGDVDVVLVGGSTLLRFYDPLQAWKEFGITSYNYATSSAKFDVLKEYIEDSRKTNDAELYVINVRTFALLSQEVDEPSLRNWSDSLEPISLARFRGITGFLFSRDWDYKTLPSFYFDIIKYHTNYDALASEEQWSYINLDNIYSVDKGFSPTVEIVPFEKKEWGDERSQLNEQQINALNDILDYCDKEKLPVLFICCPYIFSESDEGVINSCADVIQGRGYDYVNFNEYYDEIGIDFNTDFSDINHVNYLGAIKYTHFLAKYLTTSYQLADHRGEAKYIRWDEDYEKSIANMNEIKGKLTRLISEQIEAKELGDSLNNEEDFYQWNSYIKNKYYTVIIRINELPNNLTLSNPLNVFMRDYEIDISKETYIGVWNGETEILSTSEEMLEKKIGVGGGRENDICKVSTESQTISIGGVDYVANESPIQVVVYDNNYQKVIDNVNIQITSEDSLVLIRP